MNNKDYWKKVLTEAWYGLLKEYLETSEFQDLMFRERRAYEIRKMWPKAEQVFNAFKTTPLDKINVIIIGQDPYHTPDVAHGLAFSSQMKRTPPSLKNIYKEIWEESDKLTTFEDCFPSNDLTHWASQGVLLLNTILTVEQGMPLSRANQGWEKFTSFALKRVLEARKVVVVMGWGVYAQKFIKETYKDYIEGRVVPGGYQLSREPDIHKLFLFGDHPASAAYNRKRWFGNNHFTMCNMFLSTHSIPEIDWTTK